MVVGVIELTKTQIQFNGSNVECKYLTGPESIFVIGRNYIFV